ncbi:MAG TPA: hypothetical protein VKN18_30755, partial [Blastocatellia bacterium]|nr:hypothetical protein [Blastocatellia bacterium]
PVLQTTFPWLNEASERWRSFSATSIALTSRRVPRRNPICTQIGAKRLVPFYANVGLFVKQRISPSQ